MIDKIITECINRFLVSEGLNNNDSLLYHNTSTENLLKMMETNSINSGHHRGFGGSEENSHTGICFTRNKHYNPYLYYCIVMSFYPHDLLRGLRGLKLVPYADPMYGNMDEYEERLISKDGSDFVIDDLSERVNDVIIDLTALIDWVSRDGIDPDEIMIEIGDILSNNIFGNKLKVVTDLKSMKEVPLDINSIKDAFFTLDNGGEYDNNTYHVYSFEIWDEEFEEYSHEEFYHNRADAISDAQTYYNDTNGTCRVTYGVLDNDNYDVLSVVCEYGEINNIF